MNERAIAGVVVDAGHGGIGVSNIGKLLWMLINMREIRIPLFESHTQ